MQPDELLELILAKFGGFETWQRHETQSVVIRFLATGNTYEIPYRELAIRTEREIMQYIIDFLSAEAIKDSKPYLLEDSTDPKVKRIKEINDELDILRGRVATPRGYIVNPERVKSLISELKELLKGNDNG